MKTINVWWRDGTFSEYLNITNVSIMDHGIVFLKSPEVEAICKGFMVIKIMEPPAEGAKDTER